MANFLLSISYSLNSIVPVMPDLIVKDGSPGREILTMVSPFDWTASDASLSGAVISFTVPMVFVKAWMAKAAGPITL